MTEFLVRPVSTVQRKETVKNILTIQMIETKILDNGFDVGPQGVENYMIKLLARSFY